jgi:hypothetical protein
MDSEIFDHAPWLGPERGTMVMELDFDSCGHLVENICHYLAFLDIESQIMSSNF